MSSCCSPQNIKEGVGTMKKIVCGLISVSPLSVSGAAWKLKTSRRTKSALTSPDQSHKNAAPTETIGYVKNTNGRTVSGATGKLVPDDEQASRLSSAAVNGWKIYSNAGRNRTVDNGIGFQLRVGESIEN